MLALDPEHAQELDLLDGHEGSLDDRASHVFLLLADVVVASLGGEPIRFVCDGQQVGRVEIIESPFGSRAVRVRGHVALTCLSWLLYGGRSGYSLGLPGP
jgi:hypothetical protein